jgi:hypothetical protein
MDIGADLGAGVLSSRTRERVAAELREEAALPAFASPRLYGLRLGFRLRLGPEPTTAHVLVYPWCADARELGGEQHLALACGWLLRRGLAHDRADAYGLAVDIALPPEERTRGLAHLVWHQRRLPAAVIRDVCERSRLRA